MLNKEAIKRLKEMKNEIEKILDDAYAEAAESDAPVMTDEVAEHLEDAAVQLRKAIVKNK